MAIPNVSTLYHRINKGSEGGNEFARFVRLLLISEFKSKGQKFISESDASGDYKKVDAYCPGDKEFRKLIIGFQFKFFPSALSSNQKKEIIHSIKSALEENKYLQEFILITPEDFQNKQQIWFNSVKEEYEKDFLSTSNGLSRHCSFTVTHWGHSKIIELALKHDHIGYHYFPELFPVGIGKFKIAIAKIDCINSLWNLYLKEENIFMQDFNDRRRGLTSDPLFDFQFTNSSPEIFLLQGIEIQIEKIQTRISGHPAKYYLKSVGTIQHEIDFTKKKNTIEFNEPMIFGALTPKRFKLQLNNFTRSCPGNYVQLKFLFHFNNYCIPTNSFYLIF